MIANNIRMSRISNPRATLWATTLLVIVFLGFGVWAEASSILPQTGGLTLDNHIPSQQWLSQITAVLG